MQIFKNYCRERFNFALTVNLRFFCLTVGQHLSWDHVPDPETHAVMANCPLLVHLMTKAPCQACIITTDSHVHRCTNLITPHTHRRKHTHTLTKKKQLDLYTSDYSRKGLMSFLTVRVKLLPAL